MKSQLLRAALLVVAIISFGCKQETQIYRLGALLPLSGEAEGYGEQVKNGITLAMTEINDKGGIQGRKIDFFFEDDRSSEEKAKDKTKNLIKTNHVPLIIGGVTSNIALAIAPICNENKVILLSPSASSPKLSGAGQYFFRNYPSDTIEGRVMADYAVRRMKIRSVAILYLDKEYGQGLMKVFKDRFTSLGGTILHEQGYPEGTTDFKNYIAAIKVKTPDAIYLPGYFTEIAHALDEIHKQKLKVKLISSGGMASPRFFDLVDEEAAEGVIYPQPPYDPKSNDQAVQSFVSAYKKKFFSEPGLYAAYAYDAVGIVEKAIIACGVNYPQDLRSRLADVSGFKGITGEIAFDPNGDVDTTPRMFQVKGGQFVPLE
jgi:branched-chain amino acid transport system substrate-binding protein